MPFRSSPCRILCLAEPPLPGEPQVFVKKRTRRETRVLPKAHYSNCSRPDAQVPVTLEDEQSYLLGEKDHLLFTVQERKITIDTRGNLENNGANLPSELRRGRARSNAAEQGRAGTQAQHKRGCFPSKHRAPRAPQASHLSTQQGGSRRSCSKHLSKKSQPKQAE